MDEETLKLLTDLHINNYRQGPGSDAAFKCALDLSGIDTKAALEIADVGCGTGSATIPLLQNTNSKVTAVELLPAFLEKLKTNVDEVGVADRLTAVEADMSDLPFNDEQFDVIWSEGAIYNMGFKNGIRSWHRFLKPNGIMVLSEITWLQKDVPETLRQYWEQEYPEIATASEKIAVLEENGYVPIGYFILTPDCWLDEYYSPIQANLSAFLERNANSDKAKEVVEAEKNEYELYKKYQEYFSYGVYIVKKINSQNTSDLKCANSCFVVG